MLRWWGIRHVRWMYLSYRYHRYLQDCQSVGLGFLPQQTDLEYLEAVRRGYA